MSVIDFLDGGHKQEPMDAHPCEHGPPGLRFKTYKMNLSPDVLQYRHCVSMLRFHEFKPVATSPHHDVALVVDIFNKYLLRDDYPRRYEACKDGVNTSIYLCHKLDPTKTREFYCSVQFVSPGQLCWGAIPAARAWQDSFLDCPVMGEFFKNLVATFEPPAECPKFVALTDGEHILLFNRLEWSVDYHYLDLIAYPADAGLASFRHALCLLLCQRVSETEHSKLLQPSPWFKVPLGALNDPQIPADRPLAAPVHATGFRDFDRFTLQRSLPDLKFFLEWKSLESKRLCSKLITSGALLDIDVDALKREEGSWNCPFPNPNLPTETQLYVARKPRPCQNLVHEMLRCKQTHPLTFEVTKVVRHEPEAFSQVFFGVLRASNGTVSPPICLKLYVDAMFEVNPDDLLEEFEEENNPRRRLWSLHQAEDLAKREQAAYERLSGHQGSLIPHCYGFHRFSSQDGTFNAYGALLEVISGPCIADAEPNTWNPNAQRDFIRQMREGLRALLYAGVDQGDWHAGQVLLPDGPTYHPETDALVFIDFALAVQRFGDEHKPGNAAIMTRASLMNLRTVLVDWVHMDRALVDVEFDWDSMHFNEF
uniref:Protein kinase domain-containing protein n=1 Tax=Mycena chlorophos TaxID=658473 RepID=A0ABQ0LJ59_MYCCL|nr:predicted protein [Mycena chlorophos]